MAEHLYLIESGGTLRRFAGGATPARAASGFVNFDQSLVTGISGVRGMTPHMGNLYFCTSGTLYRVNFTDGAPTSVTAVANIQRNVGGGGLASNGTALRVMTSNGYIYSLGLNGATSQIVRGGANRDHSFRGITYSAQYSRYYQARIHTRGGSSGIATASETTQGSLISGTSSSGTLHAVAANEAGTIMYGLAIGGRAGRNSWIGLRRYDFTSATRVIQSNLGNVGLFYSANGARLAFFEPPTPPTSLAARFEYATDFAAAVSVESPNVELAARLDYATNFAAALSIVHPDPVNIAARLNYATDFRAALSVEHPEPVDLAARLDYATDFGAALTVVHPPNIELAARLGYATDFGAGLTVTHPPDIELAATLNYATDFGAALLVVPPHDVDLAARLDYATDFAAVVDVDHPEPVNIAATLNYATGFAAALSIVHPDPVNIAARLNYATDFAAAVNVTAPPVELAARLDYATDFRAALSVEHPEPVNIAARFEDATDFAAQFHIRHQPDPPTAERVYAILGRNLWRINPRLPDSTDGQYGDLGTLDIPTNEGIVWVGNINDALHVVTRRVDGYAALYRINHMLVGNINEVDVGDLERVAFTESTSRPTAVAAFDDVVYFYVFQSRSTSGARDAQYRWVAPFNNRGTRTQTGADLTDVARVGDRYFAVGAHTVFSHIGSRGNVYVQRQGIVELSGPTIPRSLRQYPSGLDNVVGVAGLGGNLILATSDGEYWEMPLTLGSATRLSRGATNIGRTLAGFATPVPIAVNLAATLNYATDFAANVTVEHPEPVNIGARLEYATDFNAGLTVEHPQPVNIAARFEYGTDFVAGLEVKRVPPTGLAVRFEYATDFRARLTVAHPEPVNIAARFEYATDFGARVAVQPITEVVELAATFDYATDFRAELVVTLFPRAPLNIINLRSSRLSVTFQDDG